MVNEQQIITQTKNWIQTIVIGCNFCPFASREFKQNSIHYQVETGTTLAAGRAAILNELKRLDKDRSIGTSLLIFPNAFPEFKAYLDFVAYAEKLLQQKKYTGVYQIASFHPLYQFDNTPFDDPANFTNRSIYPMLHFLREAHVRQALKHYPNAEAIPERNIQFAREKGEIYLRMLIESCM
jgi:uncharacterized protein